MAALLVVGAGCDPAPTRPPIVVDAQPMDSGPRDSGSTDSGPVDAGDSGAMDAGDGAVQPVTCFANSPQELFRSAFRVGGQVPFGAAANVDGVFVGATVQTESGYPFFERIGVFMSQISAVSAPVAISPGAMTMTESISIAQSGSGFVVAFEDAPELGMSPEVYLRFADNFGLLFGAGPTQRTTTNEAGFDARIARTSAGFVTSWSFGATGPTTAALDGNGTLVAAPTSAAATVGTSARLVPMVINGVGHFAYFGTDGLVRAVSANANGAVTGSSRALSALTSTSNFSVASGAATGALVYETSAAGGKTVLQFRALSSTGTASIAERTLTPVGDEGQRPVVVPLAGGFLVAYRYVPASGVATLRVAFTDGVGVVLSSLDVVQSFPATSKFTLVVSPDSEVYVVYDTDAVISLSGGGTVNGGAVLALRLVCQ